MRIVISKTAEDLGVRAAEASAGIIREAIAERATPASSSPPARPSLRRWSIW